MNRVEREKKIVNQKTFHWHEWQWFRVMFLVKICVHSLHSLHFMAIYLKSNFLKAHSPHSKYATRINFNMSSHLSCCCCCWPPFAMPSHWKAFVFACQSVCLMRYGHISFFLTTYESIAVMVLLQTKSSASASATNL